MKNTSITFVTLNPEMPTIDSCLLSLLEVFCAYASHISYMLSGYTETFRKTVSPTPCSFPQPFILDFFCSSTYRATSPFGGYMMHHWLDVLWFI